MSQGSRSPAAFDVSVVIPLFNKASYIADTLRSVIGQSLLPREILVIDDGSSDDSAAIVRSLADPLVRLIEQGNAGPGPARNRGIADAKGEWIAFLDADDLWLPDHLAELALLTARDPAVAFLATSYREVGEHSAASSPPDLAAVGPRDFFALPVDGRNICSSSLAVRTEILRASGGFGAAMPGEDVDLWIRLGLDHPVLVSPRVTVLYRRETGGLTDLHFAGRKAATPVFMENLDSVLNDQRHRDRHALIGAYRDRWHRVLARQALAFGDVATARRHLAQAAPSAREDWVLRALALFPAPLVRAASAIRSAIKSRRLT